jgi:integrase
MLTTAAIDALPVPPFKAAKHFDGDGTGLYLLVMPRTGSKGWRLKYTFAGKASTKSFGAYPDVSPELARERCAAFKAELGKGNNPVTIARAEREQAAVLAAATFGRVAQDFLRHDDTLSERTRAQHTRYLGHLKKFQTRPLASITTKELVDVCRVIEARGNRETAHRVASFADRVFRYAVQSGLADANPAGQMRGALKPVKVQNRPGIVDPKYFGHIMRWIDGDTSLHVTVRHALRLLARVFVRPGELQFAEWSEFDLKAAEWTIPGARMKMDRPGKPSRPHWVPLSSACVDILKAQYEISGEGRYVFPSVRHDERPISENTLGSALKSLFILETVPHGFRTSASTMLREAGFPRHVVEAQLSHQVDDPVEGAYNKALYRDERRAMMDRWSQMIEEMKLKTEDSK